MSPEQVQWMPALLALGVGAVLGIVVLFRNRGSVPAPEESIEAVLTLRDLEQEREAVLAQLRELDDRAPNASRDRLELELQGARVLRAIESLGAGAQAEVPGARRAPLRPEDTPAPETAASPWTAFAWGVVTVLIVAGIGLFVSRSATQKEGSAMAAAPQEAAPTPSPELAQMEAAVTADPDNVEMRLAATRGYLMANQLMDVWRHTEYILQRQPANPAALTYQSIVRAAMGEMDAALEMNRRALLEDPDFIDAYVQLAVLHASAGRPADAEAAIAEAIKRHPEEKQALETLLAQIKAQPGA